MQSDDYKGSGSYPASSSRLPEDEIVLFTVSFSHLHYNVIQRVCQAVSGYCVVLARNCLARTLDYIVKQMKKLTVKRAIGPKST